MNDQQWYLEVNGRKVGPFSLEHIQGLFADGEVRGYHQVTSDHLEGQWITVQELVDSLQISAPPAPIEDTAPPPVETEVALPILEDADEATKHIVFEKPKAESTPAPKVEIAPKVVAAPAPKTEPVKEKIKTPAAPHTDTSDPDLEPTKFFNTSFQPPPRPADALEKSGHLPETTTPTEPAVVDPALSMLSSLQHHRERNQTIQNASKTDIDHTAREFNPSSSTNNYHRDENSKSEKKVSLKLWLTAIFAGILLGTLTWAFMKVVRSKGVIMPGSMTAIKSSAPQPSPLAVAPPHFSAPVKPAPAPAFTRRAQIPALNSIRQPVQPPPPQSAPQQDYYQQQQQQQQPQEGVQQQPNEQPPGAFPAFPPPQFQDPNNPNGNNGLNGQAPPPPPANPEGYNPNGNQQIDPGTVLNPDQNQPNMQNPAYPPGNQPPPVNPGQDQFQNQAPNPQQ